MFEQWFQWYFARYYKHGNFRYPSFLIALKVLYQITGENRVIVETGSQRAFDDLGAGESTTIFGSFCHHLGGKLITVDNNTGVIEIAKQATDLYKDNIEYVCADSIEYLSQIDFNIDLLYLDSLDYYSLNPEESQNHCLEEIRCAYHKLNQRAIVLLDDYIRENDGKCTKARQFLLSQNNCLELWLHQQSVILTL